MQLNNYKPFLGKICTILTNSTPFPFDPTKHADFFSGLVTEVNEDGVFVKNLRFNTMSFFSFPIVGIVEERGVSETDPMFEKVKDVAQKTKMPAKSMQEAAKPTRPAPVYFPPKDFTSIEDMTKMAKQIKATRQDTRQSS